MLRDGRIRGGQVSCWHRSKLAGLADEVVHVMHTCAAARKRFHARQIDAQLAKLRLDG